MVTEYDRVYDYNKEHTRICNEIYGRMLRYENVAESKKVVANKIAISRIDDSHIQIIVESNAFSESKEPAVFYESMLLNYLKYRDNRKGLKNINSPANLNEQIADTLTCFYCDLIPRGIAKINEECSTNNSIEQNNSSKTRKMR